MNNGRTGWGWAIMHTRSMSIAMLAVTLPLAGCGGVQAAAMFAYGTDEAALAKTWKGSGLECPAEYGLPAEACSIPARVASINPGLPLGEDLMPPGSGQTLLVALIIPVVMSVPFDDLRLFASDRTTAVEIPVLRS